MVASYAWEVEPVGRPPLRITHYALRIRCHIISRSKRAIMITSDLANEAASLLQQGLAAANAGDKEKAKAILRRASEVDPNNEAVWLWLASLHTDLPIVSHCLQRALALNPHNAVAEQALQAVTRKIQKGQQVTSGPLTSGPLASGPLASGPLA